jgi:hypothetical protein
VPPASRPIREARASHARRASSRSRGACTDCPEKFSSEQGSPGCFACRIGQTSLPGGQCTDRCPDGQAWSNAYQLCTICPASTVALSGAVSCTRCPFAHYSAQAMGACFPNDRIGGVMRVDVPFEEANEEAIVRDVANLLDTEMHSIQVVIMRPGSTLLYFTISDPEQKDLELGSSDLRRLGGNEKMLLLYQWWVMGDDRLDRLSFTVLDLKEFVRIEANDTNGVVIDKVVPLFAPSSNVEGDVPPQPFIKTTNGGVTWRSGVNQPKTLLLELTIGAASSMRASALLPLMTIMSVLCSWLWMKLMTQ